MDIHSRLLNERQRLGLTQRQGGEAAGVSLATYQNWERYGGFPNADALAKLFAVGFDVLYVVTGTRNNAELSNEQAQVVAQMATMDARGVAILMNTSQSITDTNPQKAG